MGQVEVQILGTGSKVVVISNQSGQDLCGWKSVAEALVSRGYEVALYNYVLNQADPLVAAASVLLILLTLAVTMIVERAMGLGKAFVR